LPGGGSGNAGIAAPASLEGLKWSDIAALLKQWTKESQDTFGKASAVAKSKKRTSPAKATTKNTSPTRKNNQRTASSFTPSSLPGSVLGLATRSRVVLRAFVVRRKWLAACRLAWGVVFEPAAYGSAAGGALRWSHRGVAQPG
jgi:hypothetical protein